MARDDTSKRKPIPIQTRWSVLSRDRFTCRYCSRSAPEVELQIDHVKAVANGGSNDLENLVVACVDCNQGKAASDVKDVPSGDFSRRLPVAKHPLVGCGFLSFVGGRVCEQGLIVAVLQVGKRHLAQCQFFEWLMGEETYQRLIDVSDIVFDEPGNARDPNFERKTYRLFKSNDERNSYYEYKTHKKGPDAFGDKAR